jgi:cytidylate kinase
VSEKKDRSAKPLMEIRPITKTNKVNPLRVLIYGLIRWVTIGIYHIYYDIKWEGVENVPKDGGNIFASNHRSYQDPVFIALHARVPLSYMAKEELFQGNKAFKWLITKLGAFPVARGKGDTGVIDTSIEKLEAGRNLAIFPEGTRSRDGKVGKGKTGVALIAAVAQTKIIPVGITFEGKLKFRKKVIVRYGKPIIPSEIGAENTDSKSLRVLKNKVMEDITDLVNE